jgi:hypothetical protein
MVQKPTYYIKVKFDRNQADRHALTSRVRDFGETMYRDLRHEPRLEFDFGVIDAAWDRFYFTATSELLARRAASRVVELLPGSNLTAEVTVLDRLDDLETPGN